MAKNKAWTESCQRNKRKVGPVILVSNKVKCKPKIIEGNKENCFNILMCFKVTITIKLSTGMNIQHQVIQLLKNAETAVDSRSCTSKYTNKNMFKIQILSHQCQHTTYKIKTT